MPTLIEDWRTHFRMGKLPFLQVQLTNFQANGGAPPGPIDPGSAWDPSKRQARRRPAPGRFRAHVAYEQEVIYEGPVFESFSLQPGRVQVTFEQVGEGLMIGTKDGTHTNPVVENAAGPLRGFALTGADQQWKPALAVIDPGGQTVTVSAAEVPTPVAVRYAWADNPPCNLYNRQGLMASPFRSDPDYRVSVNDGSGDGTFSAGKTLQVTADPAPAGQHFVAWVGDVKHLDDASKSPATLTVPQAYVSIRATYAP